MWLHVPNANPAVPGDGEEGVCVSNLNREDGPTTGIFAVLTADKLSDITRVKIKNLLRSVILSKSVKTLKHSEGIPLSNSCSFHVLDHFRHIFGERQFQIFAVANLSFPLITLKYETRKSHHFRDMLQ